MKKTAKKKLVLAKETVRRLEKLDGLRHVAGGLLLNEYAGRQVTVETGCNFCETGSCCTCVNGCETTVCESYNC